MKNRIFAMVGLILGCVSITIGVISVVFSAIGLAKSKQVQKPL